MKQTEQQTLQYFLANVKTGKKQEFENMAVIPLFYEEPWKTKYLTLKQAFEKGVIEVVEKSESGSVPELKVINKGKKRVLLADGEELAGAKQNRILNTTILLKKHSTTIIPVSCTEAGRWRYSSRKFRDSQNIATPAIRKKKARSVGHSLKKRKQFRSDQNEVWNEVSHFNTLARYAPATGALKEAYDRKKAEVTEYIKAFPRQKGQRGFVVFINGKIVGGDYFSSPKAFKHLHEKILQSYAVEAKLQQLESHKTAPEHLPEQLLESVARASVSRFKSPGHGYDYRIEGEGLTGNMLVYRGEVIHFAAFAL